MSDGLCHDTCDGSAFAVVQGENCWCSDYEPADSIQTDTSNCNTSCPGFPEDTCGGDGLWGYMALGKEPAGTKGAGSSTTTSSPTTKHTTTAPTKTTDPPTSEEPTTSLKTVTAGGTTQIQTVTVVPSMVSQSAESSNSAVPAAEGGGDGGISTGAAVGIAIGVLGFIAILGAIGAFFWLRRKRLNEEAMVERSNSGRGSSAGMMSTPRTEMASVWDSDQLSGNRRNSRIMPHDPRMDPFAANLYSRGENKSHESINTIQDNHDYSRKVLRTTNPDPPDA